MENHQPHHHHHHHHNHHPNHPNHNHPHHLHPNQPNHHHQPPQLSTNQQQQQESNQQHNNNNNMAHYKFHNDCQSSVLTYEQVKRLDFVMDQTVPIHGRGSFPTLYVKLKELIRLVKYKLQKEHSIDIRDVRLNGGAASYVLAPENSHYNDLDLIFGTDLSDQDQFDVIRDVVLECLREFFPKNHHHHHQHQHFNHHNHNHHQQAETGPPTTTTTTTTTTTQTEGTGPGSSNSSSSSSSEGPTINIDKGGDHGESEPSLATNERTRGQQQQQRLERKEKEEEASATSDKKSEEKTTNKEENSSDNNRGESSSSSSSGCCSGGRIVAGAESEEARINGTFNNSNSYNNNTNNKNEEQQQDSSSSSSGMIQCHHHPTYQMPLSKCAIKEAYVHKMVKVNDDDRWSLISLGVQQSEANTASSSGQTASSMPGTQQQPGAQALRPNHHHHHHQNVAISQPTQQEFSVKLVPEAVDSQGQINSQASSIQLEPNQAAVVSNSPTQQQATHPHLNHHQHQYNHHHNHQQHYHHHHHQQQQQQHYHHNSHHQNQQRNHYQQQQQHQQQKQFPNSIELKFVDRMRRKFEFSVDSFQIILDSLIQFYDYAPQSTIASHRKLISSHPSSTMINTRPLMSKKTCPECSYARSSYDNNDNLSKVNVASGDNNFNKSGDNYQQQQHSHHQKASNGAYSEPNNKQPCVALLNSSQSYYQLPLEPANSPSISSVASSSGCSSSSSVVSSSSSSLSCDEDHEDLYCDGDSPSSSSASTSSLLSSTTSSLLSSETETLVSHEELSTSKTTSGQDGGGQAKTAIAKQQRKRNNNNKVDYGDCIECFDQLSHNDHHHLDNCAFEYCDLNGTSCAVISENFYPTVIGRSEYGDFKEALYHLEKKLIATRSPEEIRGGGLLKYCNLLVKNYKPTNVYQIRTLERYMCSRFFIDFSDLSQQQAKLESYLANHFSDDPALKFDYLTILHNVVQRSTVCLMNHELRLTLNMIRDLAFKQNEQQQQNHHNQHQKQQQQQQQQQVVMQQDQKIQTTAGQTNSTQAQQQKQQHYYQQQKPVLLQSGVYRVRLVNYTLAKPPVSRLRGYSQYDIK